MFVKICGTTNLQDAQQSVAFGADALGFIFAPSQRRVAVETAAAIAREVPPDVLLVGVFTKPDVDEVANAALQARLSAVQMHWPYDAQFVAEFESHFGGALELWQVVAFEVAPRDPDKAEARFRHELRGALQDDRIDVILLDAARGSVSGGMGQAFSWERAAAISKPILQKAAEHRASRGFTAARLVVAGGLHAGNVDEAAQILQPWGVDVVSGVEENPGKKSPDRLRAFFQAASGQQTAR